VLAALEAAGHEPVGYGGPGESPRPLDLLDAGNVRAAIAATAPDAVVHLAGQAFVPPSIAAPLATLAVNATGTAHVLEAVRSAGRPIRTLVISSAEVYGKQPPERMPLAESAPLLRFLYEHATRPEFTCRFRWQPGSIAFWDNRCCLHLALDDYPGRRRLMHRVQIRGTRP